MSTTPFPASIGRYAVLDRVGKGGMGVVYRATDPHIGRTVAIKVLHVADEALRARFLKEVQFLGTLNHPNIVTIYDSGEHGDQPFIVMEYIDGVTLAEYVHGRNQPSVPTKLKLLRELCAALDYAHQRAIVHRDIKPANLMVDRDGVLKVLDFGVARIGETQATQAGTVVGTINYMSPEQIEGRTVDKRSDIFSVGLVIYEVFALRQAFSNEGKTMWQMMQAVLREQPEALSGLCPNLDPDVERIVNRAIDKNPTERYQTLALLSRDLAKVESRLPTVASMHEETVLIHAATPAPASQTVKPPVAESAPEPRSEPKAEERTPSEKIASGNVLRERAADGEASTGKTPSQVGPAVSVQPPAEAPQDQAASASASSATAEPAASTTALGGWENRLTVVRPWLPVAGVVAVAAVLMLLLRGPLTSFFGSSRSESPPKAVADGGETVGNDPGRTNRDGESKNATDDPKGTAADRGSRSESQGPRPRQSLYDQAVAYLPTPSNPNNATRAAELFQQSCDSGDLRGCSELAQMLEVARAVPQDVSRAATLYQRACDGGTGTACNSLGNMYREGRGVTKDDAKAATLYQWACDAGIPVACANLGRAYVEGLGVNRDLFRARSLLQSACDDGGAAACNDLGVLYLRGEGGEQDEARAVQYFQRACEGGHANGCFAMGQAHSNGRALPRDPALALSFFERACDLGLPAGCNRLARQSQRGRGGRQDAAGETGDGGRRAGQRGSRFDDRPIRLSGSAAPMKTKDVPPVYPAAALVARIEGVVVIEVTISAIGQVVDTKVVRSVRLLDEAAEQAVRQWEFAPTVINGVARIVVMPVQVRFRLP